MMLALRKTFDMTVRHTFSSFCDEMGGGGSGGGNSGDGEQQKGQEIKADDRQKIFVHNSSIFSFEFLPADIDFFEIQLCTLEQIKEMILKDKHFKKELKIDYKGQAKKDFTNLKLWWRD